MDKWQAPESGQKAEREAGLVNYLIKAKSGRGQAPDTAEQAMRLLTLNRELG